MSRHGSHITVVFFFLFKNTNSSQLASLIWQIVTHSHFGGTAAARLGYRVVIHKTVWNVVLGVKRRAKVQKTQAVVTPRLSLLSITARYFVGLVRGDRISKKKPHGCNYFPIMTTKGDKE